MLMKALLIPYVSLRDLFFKDRIILCYSFVILYIVYNFWSIIYFPNNYRLFVYHLSSLPLCVCLSLLLCLSLTLCLKYLSFYLSCLPLWLLTLSLLSVYVLIGLLRWFFLLGVGRDVLYAETCLLFRNERLLLLFLFSIIRRSYIVPIQYWIHGRSGLIPTELSHPDLWPYAGGKVFRLSLSTDTYLS